MNADPTTTILVEKTADGLLMTWQRRVTSSDLTDAFETLTAYLDASPEPVHVIVDISARPMFPMLQTTSAAIPAFCHPKMAGWYVVGESSLARIIEDTLGQLSGRRDMVQWFRSMAELRGHLHAGDMNSPVSALSRTDGQRSAAARLQA